MMTFLSAVVAYEVGAVEPSKQQGFVSLFDGKTLQGWKVGQNGDSFQVLHGVIVANGPTAHLFYDGDVANRDFKNFHLKAEVKTFPHANSGIYFHTKYQESDWPKQGYEAQINNSHFDWRRTGSISAKPVKEITAKDNVWFTMDILSIGRHIIIKIDGKPVMDYTEPDNAEIGHGTFAIQAHDPDSKTYIKNIRVRILPD